MSTLLNIPRELREEILRYVTLPMTLYNSSPQTGKADKSYVDTRIYLPSRPPTNLMSTCRQLRQECLQHHTHLLNSAVAMNFDNSKTEAGNPLDFNNRSDNDFDEAAERVVDDGMTLRLTLEVQRGKRGQFGGHYVPDRAELSPRLLALLPLIKSSRKLKLIVWPGFDWWNGPPQVSALEQWRQRKALLKRINAYQVGHTEQPSAAKTQTTSDTTPKSDAVSVAIGKVLDQLPAVEELDINILIATGDLFRWDLPDVKWERIQPWLDSPITKSGRHQLCRISRRLTSVWHRPELDMPSHQPFYVQKETRSDVSSRMWRVERQAGLRAPMFEHLAQLAALELPDTSIDETFERVDS